MGHRYNIISAYINLIITQMFRDFLLIASDMRITEKLSVKSFSVSLYKEKTHGFSL